MFGRHRYGYMISGWHSRIYGELWLGDTAGYMLGTARYMVALFFLDLVGLGVVLGQGDLGLTTTMLSVYLMLCIESKKLN